MTSEHWIGLAAIAVFVPAIYLLLWWYSPASRARRRMRRVPITTIAALAETQTSRVIGRVAEIVGEPLEAPTTGTPCAYWSIVITQLRARGKTNQWVPIFSASEARDFWLEDESGRACVSASAGATWVVVADTQGKMPIFTAATPQNVALFRRFGVEPYDGGGEAKLLRFEERKVEIGERVAVLGVGRIELDPSAAPDGYRGSGKRRLIHAGADGPLIVSDERGLTSG